MHTGMLWFDNSQMDISVKVRKAMEYYRKKYGRKPDLCLVHPSMLLIPGRAERVGLIVDGMTVRPYRQVLPGHIWIGIEDTVEAKQELPA
jgi:hypothetical protein